MSGQEQWRLPAEWRQRILHQAPADRIGAHYWLLWLRTLARMEEMYCEFEQDPQGQFLQFVSGALDAEQGRAWDSGWPESRRRGWIYRKWLLVREADDRRLEGARWETIVRFLSDPVRQLLAPAAEALEAGPEEDVADSLLEDLCRIGCRLERWRCLAAAASMQLEQEDLEELLMAG